VESLKKPKKAQKSQKKPESVPDIPENTQEKTPEIELYEAKLAQLSDKQARFVAEYLIDLNRTKAAERAGYEKSNAASYGNRLVKKPQVAAAIDAGKVLIAKRLMINQDEVIKELCRVGFSDITDFVEFSSRGVSLKESATLTKDQRRAISEVSESNTKDGSTIKFKLHDKVKALLGVLDRVKPGADDPLKVEIDNKSMTNMPPQPKTIGEWVKMVDEMDKILAKGKKDVDKDGKG
jgi:phage terminase small subunit